jgi:hypothetical protein
MKLLTTINTTSTLKNNIGDSAMGFDEWTINLQNSNISLNQTSSSNHSDDQLANAIIRIIFMPKRPDVFDNCSQFPTLEPTMHCMSAHIVLFHSKTMLCDIRSVSWMASGGLKSEFFIRIFCGSSK